MELDNNLLLLPTDTIDVARLLASSGYEQEQIESTLSSTGFSHLHIERKRSLSEFVDDGVTAVKTQQPEVFHSVDSIITVSQSFDMRIPALSTRIQRQIGVGSSCYCVDIIDGCSGFIKAVNVASMLGKEGFRKTLIIAGDLNSKLTEQSELGTRILFGDGISITTVRPTLEKSDIILRNRGDLDGVLKCSVTDNTMVMNGFEVFRFTRSEVPKLVNDYLASKERNISDYDLIGLHQASKLVVDSLSSLLHINNQRTKNFTCSTIGNIGAGSIGAWLTSITTPSNLRDASLLAVGFGSGLSWGLASLTVNTDTNEVIYV